MQALWLCVEIMVVPPLATGLGLGKSQIRSGSSYKIFQVSVCLLHQVELHGNP